MLSLVVAALGGCAGAAVGAGSAQGSNTAFRHEITTDAPPDAVWRLWMDVATWASWDQGLKNARADAPLALNVTGIITPQNGPDARFVVTAFDPGRSYAFTTALPLATLTVTRTITGEHPTRFRHDVRFAGILGAFWAAQLGPTFRAALPPTMDAIRARAEGRPQ